jgi:hypothetical protein
MSDAPAIPASNTDAFGAERTPRPLKCVACSHRFKAVVSKFEVFDQACPSCGCCRSCPDLVAIAGFGPPAGKQYVGRQWGATEGASMAMPEITDPASQANWRRDVPSIEFNDRGQVRFRDDRHQRQVYREMEQARKRFEEMKHG